MGLTAANKTINIETKPRNFYIAFLMSLFYPGLGQIYNGQPKKGAILFVLFLLPFLLGLTGLLTSFYGLLSILLIEIALVIYIIIDDVIVAKRQKEYVLKPYNTWYYYLLLAVVMTVILHMTYFGIKNFIIPSVANCPTLQTGDLLMADMKAFKNTNPQHVDIVVFKDPSEKFNSLRVGGLPGDNLELIDNIVTVNGKPAKATLIKETNRNNEPVTEFEEELPKGHKHLIYNSSQPGGFKKTTFKIIVVFPDSNFLLGVNRDNANDSRYARSVSKDRIKGKIMYSFWGQTPKRRNIDLAVNNLNEIS